MNHRTEAERLLVGAQNVLDVAPLDGLTRRECADLAQTHALLALVDAVKSLRPEPRGRGEGPG